ncbi:MAG: type II CRISPR-associated endonuclease Cas1 [Syntrophobacterales bacterium]|jgi:CRISPR-associated endonuclease Cas1 subtype II|nr:type II CRISPR-associated endonuclease Cas1 [Syntrophobacterales bacterium]
MAGFRTIVINKRCKLESLLGSLVVRSETEERIHIKEIETLIIESTAVALTAALVADLTEAGANIIFCDKKHLPASVFLPVHAHFSAAKNIKEQIAWNETLKARCWRQIIKEKIRQQALFLSELDKQEEHSALMEYQNNVRIGDFENHEARAAAVYFRVLFGSDFSRSAPRLHNFALNYGYTLLMAAFAREISACGYLTELGIWHKGVENAFNLASDLMEPFRVVVDRFVVFLPEDDEEKYKRYMLPFLYSRVKMNGENQSLVPAIRIYLHRIFRFMRQEVDDIFGIEILDEKENRE